MGVNFTAEQRQVIELRNRNILVSAAAGSGKTAVLVERIITRLTKDEKPLNVDELLIVTFTEAAASEMKERIHGAIEKALEAEPDNVHLQRQATLIHQAQITTIHKFCLSVIRDYFHTIDLDPGFRVAETGELKLLQRDVVEQILEDAYQENAPQFVAFVESFASGRDDHKLEELIIQLYEHSRSYPDPEEWLNSCVTQYDVNSEQELEEKPFVQEIQAEVRRCLADSKEYLEYGIEVCDSEDGPKVYKDALQDDCLQLQRMIEKQSFSDMQQIACSIKWATLAQCRDKTVSERKKEQVKGIRDEVKKRIKSIVECYFFDTVETMQKEMLHARDNIDVLTDLTKKFAHSFSEEKKKKNLIDFSDMEQYALQILTRKENGMFIPSAVAESYQEKYAEVMIDEYQDSNYVQEAILTSVSGVTKGSYNVFMVGDVKQSIYRFRLSRPELFMEKFHTYSLDESEKQRIDLHKNFRSRKEVLNSTNFVFEQIMVPEFGGISYDDKAALYVGASYEEKEGNETELLLIETPGYKAKERIEIEAGVIAKRIKELMADHMVYDKKTDSYRKAQYKDIVILTRSMEGWADEFSSVLNAEGIPTYTTSKEGYFETQEIRLMLQYLNILDNPRQDIPFAAVLSSSFVGLDSEELACIRNFTDKKTLYECVCGYLEAGPKGVLLEKLSTFIKQFEGFRNRVPYTAIHALLWQILEETGYGDYVSALPGGEQRSANLEMLIEKAVAFEGTSYKGLFNFVRYIEQLQKYKVDYGEANLMDEQHDVVSLMTIHKSKGLEFPIVFVAGLGKQFNMQDTRQSVVIHSDLGVGVDSIDSVLRTRTSTILKKAIQQKNAKESKAEELRVLYVAMTRAKEKLILTGTGTDFAKDVCDWMWILRRKEAALPYQNLTKANKYMDWVLPALLRNRCAEKLLELSEVEVPFQNPLFKREVPVVIKRITMEDLVQQEVEEQIVERFTKEILQEWDANQVYDKDMKKQLDEQFGYCYPHKEGLATKQKLSVSELKKKAYIEEEEEVIPLLPKFLREEETLTGASKGSAYHKLLEVLDHTKEYSEESLKAEIARFREEGLLTEEMASCIVAKEILIFLLSPIGKRMKAACARGKCYKERPFVLGIDAKRVYSEGDAAEVILVQGIIDVYFEEDDGLVVLDYKTDKVFRADALIDRYHAQLEYYGEALEKLTGKKVKERIIYSFALQQEVHL